LIFDLVHIDQELLLAINGAHTPMLDQLCWYISQAWIWIPLYLVLIALLIKQFGWKKGLIYVAALFVAAGLSDFISSGIIKGLVCRLRPTHEPALEGLVHIVNGYTGGKYGFVSSHAANTMSVALLFSLIWRQKNNHGWWLMLYVALNCHSRMYLGVHYPGDIIGGLALGSLVAVGAYWALKVLVARVDAADDRRLDDP
jgi:undecaprenyl-diphosphatase